MHKLVKFYLGSIDNIGENYAQNLIDMFTDSGFLFGTYKTIKYMQDQNMTVYQYILTYEYSESNGYGVNHAQELRYLFDPPFGSRPDCCHLRLCQMNFILLLSKPYVNEVTLKEQKCPLKCYKPLSF